MRVLTTLLTVAFACSLQAAEREDAPELRLRATPRVAMAPASVLVTVELVGGDELERFYCPGLEWDWGDGSRSVRESDCEPWREGATVVRRYSARHVYYGGGEHTVRVRMFRAEQSIAVSAASIVLRSRFDP